MKSVFEFGSGCNFLDYVFVFWGYVLIFDWKDVRCMMFWVFVVSGEIIGLGVFNG